MTFGRHLRVNLAIAANERKGEANTANDEKEQKQKRREEEKQREKDSRTRPWGNAKGRKFK